MNGLSRLNYCFKLNRTLADILNCQYSTPATMPKPLKPKKAKATAEKSQYFVDMKHVRTIGGRGGDGCISFLQLWSNENAGPDGGDGGNGAHVIFRASIDTKDLSYVPSVVRATEAEKGRNKDCHGKNADHLVINVPIGTLIRNIDRTIVGDLSDERLMFVAARGGAGGRGNHYFTTDVQQAPEIAEYGADGEDLEYTLELRSMAHVGLIGFPNAGKSTLLRAISRARPKVAPYPFTTLKPHIGMVLFEDYEQIAVADLPGIIPDSHLNRGLGIRFLRHIERCRAILYVIDLSVSEPCEQLTHLHHELSQFSSNLIESEENGGRPRLVVANKIDLPETQENLDELKNRAKEDYGLELIEISAKTGKNLSLLLEKIRIMYDKNKQVT